MDSLWQPTCFAEGTFYGWVGVQWPFALWISPFGFHCPESLTSGHLDCIRLNLEIVWVGTFTWLSPLPKQTSKQNHFIKRHKGILISLHSISEDIKGDDGWLLISWIFSKLHQAVSREMQDTIARKYIISNATFSQQMNQLRFRTLC